MYDYQISLKPTFEFTVTIDSSILFDTLRRKKNYIVITHHLGYRSGWVFIS